MHGPPAIAAPGATSGLTYCAVCHGADFAGGAVNTPAEAVHGVPAPHPRAPWRGGASSHTKVDPGNTPACAPATCNRGCPRRPGASTTRSVTPSAACTRRGGTRRAATARRQAPPGILKRLRLLRLLSRRRFPRLKRAGLLPSPTAGRCAPPAVAVAGPVHAHDDRPGECRPRASPATAMRTRRRGPRRVASTTRSATRTSRDGPGRIVTGRAQRIGPSPTRGLPACQSCHGRLFDGGVPGASCYRAGGCHTRPTPHSPGPWRGARTHTATWTSQGGGGNAAVCALCHRRPGAPGACRTTASTTRSATTGDERRGRAKPATRTERERSAPHLNGSEDRWKERKGASWNRREVLARRG